MPPKTPSRRPGRRPRRALLAALACLAAFGLWAPAAPAAGHPADHAAAITAAAYHIDSVAGNDANDGLSPATAWRTFAPANARTFQPGDSVLLARGGTWTGQSLTPKGSGTPAAPITIGAFGTGALPRIDCGAGNGVFSCVFLIDQSGWVIRDLEVTGTKVDSQNGPAGIYIESTQGRQSYFRIFNVIAHDLWYGFSIGAYKYGRGGNLWNQRTGNNPGFLDDVVIDGVEAYANGGATGNGGKGIEISGNYDGGGFSSPRNTNIVVRNANLHDNPGDGIVMTSTVGGLMEFITANRNGFQADDRYGIWPWNAQNITVQFVEAGFNETATSKGGGGFDCDYNVWGCTFQYSYAHDNKGPGQLLIGYDRNNVLRNANVRYNLFVDNCWHPTAPDCGDLVVFGRVFDSHVHNNTVYFRNRNNNPNKVAAVFQSTFGKFGQPSNFNYTNNVVYADNNSRVYYNEVGGTYAFDHNLLFAPSGNLRAFWRGTEYATVAALRQGTGQEPNGRQANPQLTLPGGRAAADYRVAATSPAVGCGLDLGPALMGTRDYFGNPIPNGAAYDVGFHEAGSASCQ